MAELADAADSKSEKRAVSQPPANKSLRCNPNKIAGFVESP
jgi:hypothetical protein